MFLLRRPNDDTLSRFLAGQRTKALSYAPVGLSGRSPSGYHVDEHRVKLGSGQVVFERAKSAIDGWACFELGWVEISTDAQTPEIGTTVAVLVHHLGFWSLNACRVVLRFPLARDDDRYGFAYGTLGEHAEKGEEQFAVRFDRSDGSVWYEIRAVSRPRAAIAKLGGPVSRRLQRKFREDSGRAMLRAVGTVSKR